MYNSASFLCYWGDSLLLSALIKLFIIIINESWNLFYKGKQKFTFGSFVKLFARACVCFARMFVCVYTCTCFRECLCACTHAFVLQECVCVQAHMRLFCENVCVCIHVLVCEKVYVYVHISFRCENVCVNVHMHLLCENVCMYTCACLQKMFVFLHVFVFRKILSTCVCEDICVYTSKFFVCIFVMFLKVFCVHMYVFVWKSVLCAHVYLKKMFMCAFKNTYVHMLLFVSIFACMYALILVFVHIVV